MKRTPLISFLSALGVSTLLAGAAFAQPRNHEPFTLMSANMNNRSVALLDSVIGQVSDDNYIPFVAYGLPGVPSEAVQVIRQVWVTDNVSRKVYRFSAGIEVPPNMYGEVVTGPIDQLRGMEFVVENFTVYICHSGTNLGAPGDRILMFDVTGQPLGSFPVTDPTDVVYRKDKGELLISSGSTNSILRYTLSGDFIGTFVQSNGVNGIDRPMQICFDHHGEIFAAGANVPRGIYQYENDGDQFRYYPQSVGNMAGLIELDNELKHGLMLFTTQNGLYSYWPSNNQVTTQRSGEPWGYISKVQFFCWADYDRSDFVDLDDYVAFVLDFEAGVPQADFDGSGFVDLDDFSAFLIRFIDGC